MRKREVRLRKITFVGTLLFARDRNLAPKGFRHGKEVGGFGIQKEKGPA